MANSLHSRQTVADGIHIVQSLEFADAAARNAFVAASTDVGRVSRQLDDGSFWILIDTTPTWGAIGKNDNTSDLVFRPGGVQSGPIYNNELDLKAAYAATDGPVNIVFDSSISAPCVINTDWTGVLRPGTVFRGIVDFPLVKSELEFQTGALFDRLPMTFKDNLQVDSTSVNPVFVLTGNHALWADTITLIKHTGGVARGLIVMQGNGSILFVLINDFSLIQNGTIVYVDDPGAGAPILVSAALTGTQPTLNQDTIASDPGANASLNFDTLSNTGGLNRTQTGWGGSTNTGGAQPRTFFRPTSVNTSATSASPGAATLCDPSGGTFPVTLPGASGLVPGETVVILNTTTDPTPVTIDTSGADTLDGVAGISAGSIAGPFAAMLAITDGISAWFSISFKLVLTNTPPVDVDKSAASVGVSTEAARADHKHDISTDIPGTILPDDAAAEGVSTSLARADHTHAISTLTPGNIQPDDVAAEGISSAFARADHTHGIAAAAPGTIQPDDAAAEGVSTSFARADHTHAIAAAAPGTILPDDAAAEGASTSFARADHTHAIAAAVAGAIQSGDAAAEGASTSFARADHTHSVAAPAAALALGTAAAGTSVKLAREDHVHPVTGLSYGKDIRWNISNLLTDYTLNQYLDGFNEIAHDHTLKTISITQRVDGSAGTTTLEIFKISTGGAETSLGTVSLAFGGGANARATATINLAVAANFRLGVKLTAVQTDGEDVSLTAMLEA